MDYAYGNWFLVIIISGLFIWFCYDAFKPKNKVDWQSFGAFSAFIIALFAEMYGFPLTIYLLSSYFGNKFPQLNFSHNSGHLFEVVLGNSGDPHVSFLHILSYGLIIAGLVLITKSWGILYQAVKLDKIATTGPYEYIRHPQYVGFLIIIVGFLFQWPTLPTLIMAPILFIMYLRLAKKEEQKTLQTHPEYVVYKKLTPAFIPSIKKLIQGNIKL
ncbi:MAG: isoprenylcysteine carboxylmethyltransferase family protein [bacterium]|nr:isoprenylcysteine carboxylmethyltransferase family protein [bacterium]